MALINEVREQLTFDVSQVLKGLQDGIAAMKAMLSQLNLVQVGLNALRAGFLATAQVLTGSGGVVALLGGAGAAIATLYDQLKNSDVFATFTSRLGDIARIGTASFAALAAAARTSLTGLAQGLSGYSESLKSSVDTIREFAGLNEQSATALEKTTEAIDKGKKGFDLYRTSVFLLGEAISQNVFQAFSNFSLLLSDKLAPDLTAVTGEATKQSKAVAELSATYTTFAKTIQKGQEDAVGPLRDALAGVVQQLIPTNALFIRSIAAAAQYGSILTGLAGTVLGAVAPFIALGQAVQLVNAALKSEIILGFVKSMGIATTGVKSLADVFKLLKDVVVAAVIGGFTALKELLTVGLPAAFAATKAAVSALALSMGLSPGGLAAIITVSLIGALALLATSFKAVTVEAKNYDTVVQGIAKRNADLAAAIDAEQTRIRGAARGAQIGAAQSLGIPGANEDAAVFETKQKIVALERERLGFAELIKEATDEERATLQAQYDAVIAQTKGYQLIVGVIEEINAKTQEQTAEIIRQSDLQKTPFAEKQLAVQRELQKVAQEMADLDGKGERFDQQRINLQQKQRDLQADIAALERQGIEIDKQAVAQVLTATNAAVAQVAAKKTEVGLLFTIETAEKKINDQIEARKKLIADSTKLIKDLSDPATAAADPTGITLEREEKRLATNTGVLKSLEAQKDQLEKAKVSQLALLEGTRRFATEVEAGEAQLKGVNAELEKSQLQEEALRDTSQKRTQEYALQRQQIDQAGAAQASQNQVAIQQLTLASQTVDLRKQEIDIQLQSLQSEEVTVANQQKVYELQKQSLELDRTALDNRRQLVDLEVKAARDAIASTEARQRLETGTGDQRQETTLLLDQQKQRLAEILAQYKGIEVAVGGVNAELKDLEKSLRNQIELAAQLAASRSQLDQQRIALEGQSFELQKQAIGFEIQSLQNDEDSIANRKRIFELQRQQLDFDKEILENRRKIIDAEVKGIRDQIGTTEALIALEEKTGSVRQTTLDLLEQQNLALEQAGLKYKAVAVAIGGVGSQVSTLATQVQRLDQIPVNFAQIFQQGLTDTLSVAISQTGELADVFEGLRANVLSTFTDMFAQMVTKKLAFDTMWTNNWLKDIPAAVQGGASKAAGFLSSLFGGGSASASGGGLFGNVIGGSSTTSPVTQSLGAGIGGAFAGFGAGELAKSIFGFGGSKNGQLGGGIGSLVGGAAGIALTPVLGPFAPFVGSLLGNLGGSAIGSLFGKPTRINTEREDIEKFLQDELGINVPLKKSDKFIPRGAKNFSGQRGGLEALGVGFGLEGDEGGIGSIKRFANLAQAAFEQANLSIEEANQKVLELAQSMGFDLTNAL